MKLSKTPVAIATSLMWIGAAHAQVLPAPEAAASAPAAEGALPADTQAGGRRQPEVVVITATKRAQAAHKVPFNVSALTQEQLREEHITDVKKLLAETPSINAPGNPARFADSVTVRGLNVSPVNANNLEEFTRSTLAYYLDDTPLPNIAYRIKDVARVETLLGPQGTLYGAGSLGGTVRYITNRPQLGKVQGALNTSLYQVKDGGLSTDVDGVVNVPLGERFALRFSAARLDEAGYTDRIVNPPWRTDPALKWDGRPDPNQSFYPDDDWQKVNTARVSLLWRLTLSIDLLFAHAEQSQTAHGTSGAQVLPVAIAEQQNPGAYGMPNASYYTPYVVNDHTIISRYPEYADRHFKMDSIDLDWDLGAAKLHSMTSHYTDARVGQGDYAGAGDVFYGWINDGVLSMDKSNRSAYMSFDNAYSGTTHETRLVSNGDGPFNWIVGLYHTQQDKHLRFSEWVPGLDEFGFPWLGVTRAGQGGSPDEGYHEDIGSHYTETALYGEGSYRWNRWLATVGARVFNYRDDALSIIRDYTGDTSRTTDVSDGANAKAYYKLNLAYQFTPDLLGYGTFSQGFRRGGTNGFKNIDDPDPAKVKVVKADVRQYQPDSTDNLEFGVKGYVLDKRLLVQADVYRMAWKNPQLDFSQTIPPYDFPINGTTNGPRSHTSGLELSGTWRPTDDWELRGSSAYTHGVMDEDKTVCLYEHDDTDNCVSFTKGTLLGGAPKWKHSVSVSRSTMFGDDWLLKTTVGARYVGAVLNNTSAPGDTTMVYPAYTLFSASADLSYRRWDFTLWAENLTNRRALTSNNTGTGQTSRLGRRLILTTPRTIGFNLSYAFD